MLQKVGIAKFAHKRQKEMTFERIISEGSEVQQRLTNFIFSFFGKGEGLKPIVKSDRVQIKKNREATRIQGVKFNEDFMQTLGRLNTKVELDGQACLNLLTTNPQPTYAELPISFITKENVFIGTIFCARLEGQFGLWVDMRTVNPAEDKAGVANM